MVPADADLRIKLPVFEGPLDLLLFLIRKNELDIYDIPIATVTKQYIQVLRSMQQLDLEIAGEFFVMAASLMEIKSRMLLPRGQAAIGEGEDDDPLDPRWELVHQLLQYKKFKEAAAKLDELASFQRDMLARHVVEVVATENERPLKPVDRIELWNSFNLVLRRLSEKLVVGEIKGEEVTVSDKMEELLKLIETRKNFLFTELFEGKQVTVRLLVATFIAVLELTRLKKLRVRQAEAFADIYVDAVENTVNADGTLAEGQLNFAPEAPEQRLSAGVTPAASTVAPALADDDHTTPAAPEQPPLVLTSSGYATIPEVLSASAPVSAEPPSPEPTAEPAAEAVPAPGSADIATATALAALPEKVAAPDAAASEGSAPANLLPPPAPPPAAPAADGLDAPGADEISASSTAFTASEKASPDDERNDERFSSEKPLDTEPPRDTLTS